MKRAALALLVALLVAMSFVRGASAANATTLSSVDANEIASSYGDLIENYYRRLNPQLVLDGARKAISGVLARARISHPQIPPIRALGNTGADARSVQLAVERAARAAHARVSAHTLAYAAIAGMMASVKDPYTLFLDPKDFAALNQDLNGGNFGGIGVVISIASRTKEIRIQSIIPGSPADHAGIQQDDLITAVNGVPTRGMTIVTASKRLRGTIGTTVKLSIARDGKPLTKPIAIVRAKIRDVSVIQRLLPDHIGYIQLSVFGRDTGRELHAALHRLQLESMRGLILDLRENGGGYLTAAISVSSDFIASGPIVSVEERGSHITTLEATDTAIRPVPLVVLVNGHTASAAEIASGAIQDTGVGTLIGTRTFGKGVVQQIFPLPDHSAVKLTTARYFTPHNRDINHKGIQPNITVIENKHPRFGEVLHDVQFARALVVLKREMAKWAAMQPAKARPGNAASGR